jgi:hypothetical protein
MLGDGSLLLRMNNRIAFTEKIIYYLAIGFGAATMIKLGLSLVNSNIHHIAHKIVTFK